MSNHACSATELKVQFGSKSEQTLKQKTESEKKTKKNMGSVRNSIHTYKKKDLPSVLCWCLAPPGVTQVYMALLMAIETKRGNGWSKWEKKQRISKYGDAD